MPLYDVMCGAEHRREVLLSSSERDDLIEQHGDVIVPCPECGEPARRQLSLTGSMAVQWRRAAHGQST